MSLVNNRVYGSDIPSKVKKILEARQLAAERKVNPEEEIESNYATGDKFKFGELLFNDFAGEAELSSKTPWVRMWSAVELLEDAPASTKEYITEVDGTDIQSMSKKEQFNQIKSSTEYAKTIIKYDPDKAPNGQYYIIKPLQKKSTSLGFDPGAFSSPLITKQFENINRKVYVIGSNNLSQTSDVDIEVYNLRTGRDKHGRPAPSARTGAGLNAKYMRNTLLPPEHMVEGDDNKYMKPEAGITNITSETLDMSRIPGAARTTTVTFEVYNFADFDKIYNKIFLRPGAQIFVDFVINYKLHPFYTNIF